MKIQPKPIKEYSGETFDIFLPDGGRFKVPKESMSSPFDISNKYGAFELIDAFDRGYAILSPEDSKWKKWFLNAYAEDSEQLGVQGRLKWIPLRKDLALILILIDPSGMRRLHQLGVKPVPKGVFQIRILNNGTLQIDAYPDDKERIKAVKELIKDILRKEKGNEEFEFICDKCGGIISGFMRWKQIGDKKLFFHPECYTESSREASR